MSEPWSEPIESAPEMTLNEMAAALVEMGCAGAYLLDTDRLPCGCEPDGEKCAEHR